MNNYSKNEQELLKQFDSWELTEEQRQEIYKNFLVADEKAIEISHGQIHSYEKHLAILEELVQKWYNLIPKQATAIKTEGLIKGWADIFKEKPEKSLSFLSIFLSSLSRIKRNFYETSF